MSIKQSGTRIVIGLISACVLSGAAHAFDFDDLMKYKKEFEVVRDFIRKLRGREPAPPAPTPPDPGQTPVPGQTPGQTPAPGQPRRPPAPVSPW